MELRDSAVKQFIIRWQTSGQATRPHSTPPCTGHSCDVSATAVARCRVPLSCFVGAVVCSHLYGKLPAALGWPAACLLRKQTACCFWCCQTSAAALGLLDCWHGAQLPVLKGHHRRLLRAHSSALVTSDCKRGLAGKARRDVPAELPCQRLSVLGVSCLACCHNSAEKRPHKLPTVNSQPRCLPTQPPGPNPNFEHPPAPCPARVAPR